ncbi:uncharacterized protein F5Z01DRAFT_752978 [Emericellopsis atlantica]|uniref:ABM domain-containing protein n=1 Tax=Emericellopsis atlantica TaxID=2614577 RepID=A0A9P8CLF4_9HYPO|nr:uncharacterized protein F5Z01DRAFT_752978 [Emericellopsis atlantica]KAG9251338.1 hypothetical protein F5Z01DRAFT_752978 [Emericellopsis atlantica]
MPPVTQYARLTLKPGTEADALDESTPTGKIVQRRLTEPTTQPDFRAIHYGLAVERPSELWAFLDWDTVEQHQTWRDSASHDDLRKSLATISDASAPKFSLYITPQPTSVFNDPAYPVVEVLNVLLPPDMDEAAMKMVEDRWEQFARQALHPPALCGKIATGWSLENNAPVRDEEGKTGKVFLALIQWPSVDKHMENRGLPVFKDSIHLLRDLPGLLKMDMFHVHAKTKTAA